MQTYGLQDGLPAPPAAEVAHVPVEQLPHGPQALSQQIPLTQNPERHWRSAVQVLPFPAFGTQWLVESHSSPEMQSELEPHVDGQAGVRPLHTYGEHDGGAVPAERFVQVPVVQLPQPPHAVPQQTPETQKPDWHAQSVEHAVPSADGPRQPASVVPASDGIPASGVLPESWERPASWQKLLVTSHWVTPLSPFPGG